LDNTCFDLIFSCKKHSKGIFLTFLPQSLCYIYTRYIQCNLKYNSSNIFSKNIKSWDFFPLERAYWKIRCGKYGGLCSLLRINLMTCKDHKGRNLKFCYAAQSDENSKNKTLKFFFISVVPSCT